MQEKCTSTYLHSRQGGQVQAISGQNLRTYKQKRDSRDGASPDEVHALFHDDEDIQFKGTDLIQHRIFTRDAKPIRKAPFRVPFALWGEMESQVRDMLQKGVIEPSSSPWAAPATLVPKKSPDGRPKYRFCVDFRALNAVTQFDTYTLLVFEEAVATLHGSKYFSVIDCYSGVWQVKN